MENIGCVDVDRDRQEFIPYKLNKIQCTLYENGVGNNFTLTSRNK